MIHSKIKDIYSYKGRMSIRIRADYSSALICFYRLLHKLSKQITLTFREQKLPKIGQICFSTLIAVEFDINVT